MHQYYIVKNGYWKRYLTEFFSTRGWNWRLTWCCPNFTIKMFENSQINHKINVTGELSFPTRCKTHGMKYFDKLVRGNTRHLRSTAWIWDCQCHHRVSNSVNGRVPTVKPTDYRVPIGSRLGPSGGHFNSLRF